MNQPPDPFTWDSPGAFWDSGLTWDGAGTKPKNKAMNTTKAITDFSNYKDADIGPAAQLIHDKMLANAATYTTPPIAMPAFLTLVTDYTTKLAFKATRAKGAIIAANDARAELETALSRLGNYVNDVAQGDAAIVELSGFPSYGSAHPAAVGAPAAPTNLRLARGGSKGSVLARYKTQKQPSTNEVQINLGNPDTEADWKTVGIFKGLKAEITDLTPGVRVWVRVRTVGLKGVMGDWSDPAEIIVT